MTTTIAATITVTACVCAAIVTSLLMIGTAFGGNLKEKVYRWFFIALLGNTIGSFFEGAAAMLIGSPGEGISILFRIIDFFSYAFGYLTGIAFSLYVYEYLSLKKTIKKTPFIFMIFCLCANIVILAIGNITAHFALLDASNNYDSQGLTMLAQILPLLTLLMLIIVTLQNIKILKPREWVSLLIYTTMPIMCYAVENIFIDYPFWITYFGVAVVLLLLYVNIQVELKYELGKKEAELMESRMTIMLSQIQPHFLYNTLGAIDKLYFENAEDGHNAIVKFASYLRCNMDSITSNKPIQFSEELSHVRQYLWLEQLRFEENLQVFYDIQAEDFFVPVLSLQPIVENAVRRGVTKKTGGGSVTVRTTDLADCFKIEVIDDGIGFDPNAALTDGRSHVGIANVRERLRSMCNGTLTIRSVTGEGTVASIEIPKKEVAQ